MFSFAAPGLMAEGPSEAYRMEDIQQRNFDEQKWKQTVEGIDYSSDRVKERKDRVREDGRRTYPRTDSGGGLTFGTGGASAILKFFIIAFAVVVLVLILWSLLGLGVPKNTKIKDEISASIDIQKIEENIHESDLERYIRQALEKKEYDLAIRLYYLAALKELSLHKAIRWKKDKTNRTYLNEMRQHPSFQPFRSITRIFERVWYGNVDLKEEDYYKIEPEFKQFIDLVNRKPA